MKFEIIRFSFASIAGAPISSADVRGLMNNFLSFPAHQEIDDMRALIFVIHPAVSRTSYVYTLSTNRTVFRRNEKKNKQIIKLTERMKKEGKKKRKKGPIKRTR